MSRLLANLSLWVRGPVLALLTLSAVASGAEAPQAPIAQPAAGARFEAALGELGAGDEARDAGRLAAARAHYETALKQYQALSRDYPDWEPAVTRFRIAYCRNQLESLDALPVQSLQADREEPGEAAEWSVVSEPEPTQPVSTEPKAADSGDIRVVVSSAVQLLKDGDAETAGEILAAGLRLAPGHGAARLMLGIARCQAGQFADAERLLGELLKDQPENAHAATALGVARAGQGDWQGARTAFERALRQDPGLKQTHYNLAQACLVAQPPDIPAARRHYRRALELGAVPDPQLASMLDELTARTPAPEADPAPKADAAP